ncbi:MAG: ABC transporter ATP-binding protein [Anaeroplasmataceae bacterium]
MASRRPINGKIKPSRLLGYLYKTYRIPLTIVLVCLLFSAIAGLSSSVFVQQLIDKVITPGISQGFDAVSKQFFTLLAVIITIYIIGLSSGLIFTQIMARVSQGFLNKMRKDLFKKMDSLPIRYFDTNPHGEIMSTYTNDVDAIRQLIGQSLPQLISTAISITVIFGLMLFYSIWLSLIVVCGIIAMYIITATIGKGSAKYFFKQQRSLATVEGYVEEMMKGQKVVKVFSHEQESITTFNELNETLRKNSYRANRYANLLMPIMHNIGNILYVVVAIVGSILVIKQVTNFSLTGFGVLQIGVVVSYLTMSRQFANSIGQVSQQINAVVMGFAGAHRVFELLDQKPEQDEGYVTLINADIDKKGNITESEARTGKWAWKHPHKDGTITYTKLNGDIVFENVDFGYVENKIVLHDVSIYAKQGQKIAFVGATGAGKTTITNLINRFYDLADGKVRYDGININKIKKHDLRKSIGIVLQDTCLFTGTVRENIRYGRLDATDEEVIEASKIANAYDFINMLPNGFDTVLTEDGSNLSQGQRQLLAIARAAIADAPVMILDEATSSIDTRTEVLVQKGTDQLMKGRTVFVIAHRLSTIQNSDCIMVLEHGVIKERGTHDDLIKNNGIYYQLYTGAFELE